MLINLTVDEYLKKLASSEPIPGGGSVAALSAALGSALNCMVFSLTFGKKIYKELDEEQKRIFHNHYEQSKILVDEFASLVHRDSEIFNDFIKVFKLPKDTEQEKKYRSEEIKKGYKNALKVPVEILEKSEKLYDFILTAVKYGNKGIIPDAGVAVIMLHAGVESCLINVKINLNGLQDEELKKNILNKCNNILDVGEIKKKQILEILEHRINK
ncbi:cyclodeaminase/cyclohydrolase family protein [Hathewaya limosa]|uniref:Formiminotetrahydrofolate cyclodeaminase n=1 Tax=Hathewaya limosa TaxID=1536 RepID=A0ABU0JTU7_HATLI|nr:cyclodeaminase/cyclohydrolase family protein [Hathewaya limosa]MDQ0479651.1 formiminotetrahydrofolate cyclodeaminase [Hathewaya limosa]